MSDLGHEPITEHDPLGMRRSFEWWNCEQHRAEWDGLPPLPNLFLAPPMPRTCPECGSWQRTVGSYCWWCMANVDAWIVEVPDRPDLTGLSVGPYWWPPNPRNPERGSDD